MTKQTIPVVNLKDFTLGTSSQKDAFVKTIGDALVDIGFFALEGHGVDQGLIEKCYGSAREFFALSTAQKKSYEKRELNGQRGYTSFGREHAKDQPAPDLKEFWHVGREIHPNSPYAHRYVPNLWPSEVASFKGNMMELYTGLDRCASDLLKACALFLGESEGLFANMAKDGDTILRIINYPPIPEDAHPASVRSAAHEDINFITLLCESTDDGLELLQRDGKWRAIKAIPGQIVVDAGDMLQNITNGFFKSTTHRVVNPNDSRSQRFSMPFFVHPRGEVDLSPLASCVSKTGGQKTYESMTAKEYLHKRLKEIGLM